MARTFAMAVLLIASSARAQEDARARAHYEAAQAHVAAQRYDEAYAEFSAGFELSQRPAFLFNMGECAFHAGRRDQARSDYARYLERTPAGAMSDIARGRLEELGPEPAAQVAPAQPIIPAPEEVAASASRERADLLGAAPLTPARELWEEEVFWIVLGSVLALAVGGAITGGVLATQGPSTPMCGAGCVAVDFR